MRFLSLKQRLATLYAARIRSARDRELPFHVQHGRQDLHRAREGVQSEAGYSLLEIMIVIVIIGILALIAIPKFTGVTTRAKMTEAKTMLKQVHTLQRAHYYERDTYGGTLASIGFEQSPLVTEGGNARYEIAIEGADAETFVATATAVVDFDRDGTMNVWEVGPDGLIAERTPD